MLNVSKLRIDPSSLGQMKYLVGVTPSYKYDENKEKTNIVDGYRYEVALADFGLEKITVKIPGEKIMDVPTSGFVPVDFVDMEIHIYVIKGNPMITAKASKIVKVKAAA